MLVTEAAMAPPAQPLVGLLVLPDILQLPVFVHLANRICAICAATGGGAVEIVVCSPVTKPSRPSLS